MEFKFRVEFIRRPDRFYNGGSYIYPPSKKYSATVSAKNIRDAVELARLWLFDKYQIPSHELTTRKVIEE